MYCKIKYLSVIVLLLATTFTQAQKSKKQAITASAPATVWPIEKATAWYARHKWLTGANYIPATAINQLEMWQADTFDSATIDKELGWAQGIGFNTLRVFLHSVAWKEDPDGFKKRMGTFLTIADKHQIGRASCRERVLVAV